jgi:hypothetical protein
MPNHPRLTQSRTLAAELSDEFAVSLCRTHYRVVDRRVNKAESWESINLDLAVVARKLWEHSRLTEAPGDRRTSTLDASAPNARPGRR